VLSWGAGIYFESGAAPGPAGQHHPLSSPYGRFRVGGRWLNIAAANEAIWERLARALGRPVWLADPRFADVLARVRHRAELSAEIEAALAGASLEHWVEVLNAAGVPAGPVLDVAEVFADPQVLARRMLVELPHPELGTFRTTGLPFKLSRTPGRIERRPPLHGEHSDEVLIECGLARGEIDALRREGVIGGAPGAPDSPET
jgi:crotonobetainyl-CoA:carnitine CoA-transferase CaiB-like acyl-CoA transferase